MFISCVVATLFATGLAVPPTIDSQTYSAVTFDLSDTTLRAWRDHILPTQAERAWESIGWLASFSDGLRAADRNQRPLLLWVMNGHPLGCT